MLWPALFASFFLSATLSWDEFIIAFFLAGNQPTLPTYIFSQLRFPKQIPMIMALGTVLVALSIRHVGPTAARAKAALRASTAGDVMSY